MKDLFSENIIDWTTVEEYQNEGDMAGLCMALAECTKLLNYILDNQGYRGKTIYEKITHARERFSDLSSLANALEVYENVFTEYDKQVSIKDVETAIKQFREAIIDLTESEMLELGLWGRLKSWIDFYFAFRPGAFRRFVLWFLGISFALILLDTTHPGQRIVKFFANLLYSIFGWLATVGLIILAAVIIIIGSLIYFEKRKRK